MGDRLIDAFYWFGDASRDNNSSAQVVKLVTAMERLVTVKNEEKNGDITKNFYSRVSCLIAIYHGEIDKWKNQAKKSYELRSDLVHGSQSLYNTYNIELNSSLKSTIDNVLIKSNNNYEIAQKKLDKIYLSTKVLVVLNCLILIAVIVSSK